MDIVATQWSGILPGLQAGTYDFVAPTTTIRWSRQYAVYGRLPKHRLSACGS